MMGIQPYDTTSLLHNMQEIRNALHFVPIQMFKLFVQAHHFVGIDICWASLTRILRVLNNLDFQIFLHFMPFYDFSQFNSEVDNSAVQ